MAVDIKENVLRAGMSRADVIHLLGQPDYERPNGPLAYLLGMCSGLQIDVDTLDIHLNGDGKLTEVQIVQH
jgi:hypothetical protein